MLTKRFNFIKVFRLQPPDSGIDLFNVLNILALFGMFFLLNSRFILSPGVEIRLPQSDTAEMKKTVGIITIQSEKFIIFNGDIFTLDSIKYGMKKYLKAKCSEKADETSVLLVRPDKSLPVDVLLKICEIARDAGYANVQIATSSLAEK